MKTPLVLTLAMITTALATDLTVNPSTTWRGAASFSIGWNTNPYNLQYWDPATKKIDPQITSWMPNSTMQYYRYPGGTVANFFDWKQSVGSLRGVFKNGYGVLYTPQVGLDEAARFAETEGQALLWVVRPDMNPGDAADLVRYLNQEIGADPDTTPMARLRSDNGHPAPYRVKFFELGNETDWTTPDWAIPWTTEQYVVKCRELINAMSSADPTIRFIVHAKTGAEQDANWRDWHNTVLSQLAETHAAWIAGVSMHSYYTLGSSTNRASSVDVDASYVNTLATDAKARIPSAKVWVTETARWSDVQDLKATNCEGAALVCRFLLLCARNGAIASTMLHEFGRYPNGSRWPAFETPQNPRPVLNALRMLWSHGLRNKLIATTGEDSDVLGVCADDGVNYKLMVSNCAASPKTLNATIVGLSGGAKSGRLVQIKPSSDLNYEAEVDMPLTLQVGSDGKFSVMLPGNSVSVFYVPR